jgi:hypothetical protein
MSCSTPRSTDRFGGGKQWWFKCADDDWVHCSLNSSFEWYSDITSRWYKFDWRS